MSRKLIKLITFLIFVFLLAGCEKDSENAVAWGKSIAYEDFLWKKYVPDTLTQSMVFEYNDDAVRAGSVAKIGIFKKNEAGSFERVGESEVEMFVNGTRTNVIEARPGVESVTVSLVFGPQAESKTHHWYFRVVDGNSYDRINDAEPAEFNSAESAFDEIVLEKHQIWNPVAKMLFWICVVILTLLVLWFAVGKPKSYPKFKGGSIIFEIDDIPYTKKLRGYRLLVCTKSKKSQGLLNSIFTGKIYYYVNPDLWVSDVVFSPARRNIRIRYNSNDFDCSDMFLEKNNTYKLKALEKNIPVKLTVQ